METWHKPAKVPPIQCCSRCYSGGGAGGAWANESKPMGPLVDPQKTIGIQIGTVSFVDEGVNKVLDILQERGQVNTLFLAYSFMTGGPAAGRFRAGRFPITVSRSTALSMAGTSQPRTRSSIKTRYCTSGGHYVHYEAGCSRLPQLVTAGKGGSGFHQAVPYSTRSQRGLHSRRSCACLEIEKDPQNAFKYTAKGNLVAVVTNGTAVLGLGDIGALAGKPVIDNQLRVGVSH